MKFLDTYALIEFLQGNQQYQFLQQKKWCTLTVNLAELYYALIKITTQTKAKKIITRFQTQAIEPSVELMIKAMNYRHKYKKKRYSYIDCFGYIYAREQNIPFVTGDKAFKNVKGVMFIGKK